MRSTIMTGILKSGETGKFVAMQTTCERPAALGIAEAKALLAKKAGKKAARTKVGESAPRGADPSSWRRIMDWHPADNRYDTMTYNRCGRSGLKLPAISLGLWHNFGGDTPHQLKRALCRKAFDLGITHFDLANNYGPPAGSAEEAFGEILQD